MLVDSHFVILVYPFTHNLQGRRRRDRLQQLAALWQPWWARFEGQQLTRALDDTYFVFPHVRALLFPEASPLPPGESEQQVEAAQRLAALPIDQLAARLGDDAVLHFTLRAHSLRALAAARLEFTREDEAGRVIDSFAASLRIEWVDVYLFPQRVGFLAIKLRQGGVGVTTEHLFDLLHHLRMVHPPVVGWQLARWRRESNGSARVWGGRDLVDYLLQGLAREQRPLHPTLDAYLDALAQEPLRWRYTSSADGQVYGQSFYLYSFVCLAGQPSAASHEAPTDQPGQLFTSETERVLYELATCTLTSHDEYVPADIGVRRLLQQGRIAIWANWQALALHSNVVFLARGATPFTRGPLAHNVESDYFVLYLLALYQRSRLSRLAGELVRQSGGMHLNLREARRLGEEFTMFRNRYWYSEVTQKPQGKEIYDRFQQGLDVARLYQRVSDEVRALEQYYEGWQARRTSAMLAVIAFIGLPLSIVSTLFGSPFASGIGREQALLVVAAVLLLTLAGWLLWYRRG